MEHAVVFQNGGEFGKIGVFGGIFRFKVADNVPLLVVQLTVLNIRELREFFDWIDQLFPDKVDKGLGRSLSPVFLFEQLAVSNSFQCWILGYMESGANGCWKNELKLLDMIQQPVRIEGILLSLSQSTFPSTTLELGNSADTLSAASSNIGASMLLNRHQSA